MLELTDFCNLSCPMCDQSGHRGINTTRSIHGYPKRFINKSLISKLLENIKTDFKRIDNIALFWQGESLMHPDFTEILERVLEDIGSNKVIKSFLLHTNAILMDKKIRNILLQQEIKGSAVHFSIDSSCSSIYNIIRRGGDFSIVQNNIKEFLKLKKSRNLFHPVTNLQFIVMKENENDALKFYRYWKNFLEEINMDYSVSSDIVYNVAPVCIYFRKLGTGPETKSEIHCSYDNVLQIIEMESGIDLTSKKNSIEINIDKENEVACKSAWYSPVISSNGIVTACCLDMKLDYLLGNIENDTLYEIWNSETAWQFRKNIKKRKYNQSGINSVDNPLLCSNCKFLI